MLRSECCAWRHIWGKWQSSGGHMSDLGVSYRGVPLIIIKQLHICLVECYDSVSFDFAISLYQKA